MKPTFENAIALARLRDGLQGDMHYLRSQASGNVLVALLKDQKKFMEAVNRRFNREHRTFDEHVWNKMWARAYMKEAANVGKQNVPKHTEPD